MAANGEESVLEQEAASELIYNRLPDFLCITFGQMRDEHVHLFHKRACLQAPVLRELRRPTPSPQAAEPLAASPG